jgi:hypothetical protein
MTKLLCRLASLLHNVGVANISTANALKAVNPILEFSLLNFQAIHSLYPAE